MESDTIAALATPPGVSAIAVVRMSGSKSLEILSKIARREEVSRLEPQRARVIDFFMPSTDGEKKTLLDKCVVLAYASPHSYTGEDMVEIYCHGGRLIPRLLLEALVGAGARFAKPGEFTQRAFLNEKLDLLQAESVDAVVGANSISALHLAHDHYTGRFSNKIKQLRAELIDLLSLLELELDFAEEDVEFASRSEIEIRLASLREMLAMLHHSYGRTHLIQEGLKVAIVGRPNVGKSSLLNLLLKKERAIVTEEPGTTRDVISESMEIGSVQFTFFDTAGIRETKNIIEQEGIRRSEEVIENADMILFLVDQNCHLSREDWEVRQRILQAAAQRERRLLLLFNKCDLPATVTEAESLQFARGFESQRLSCVTSEGFAGLEQFLMDSSEALIGSREEESLAILNLRQRESLARALGFIENARHSFRSELSQEFVSADLRNCLGELGELVGEITSEDILGNIFSKFCIGK